ncbi:hypothetical protein AOQ84DRAFT_219758 [Glonium stellatum]|uniref:Uncharacterized protein n=1 Tax=Glonium stellatum TaxID=574774 RepID=A0A8E2FDV8_9PEZI|nr:hypothetical protein AOQ84DRAFT_219758 [Glonium stellatum]
MGQLAGSEAMRQNADAADLAASNKHDQKSTPTSGFVRPATEDVHTAQSAPAGPLFLKPANRRPCLAHGDQMAVGMPADGTAVLSIPSRRPHKIKSSLSECYMGKTSRLAARWPACVCLRACRVQPLPGLLSVPVTPVNVTLPLAPAVLVLAALQQTATTKPPLPPRGLDSIAPRRNESASLIRLVSVLAVSVARSMVSRRVRHTSLTLHTYACPGCTLLFTTVMLYAVFHALRRVPESIHALSPYLSAASVAQAGVCTSIRQWQLQGHRMVWISLHHEALSIKTSSRDFIYKSALPAPDPLSSLPRPTPDSCHHGPDPRSSPFPLAHPRQSLFQDFGAWVTIHNHTQQFCSPHWLAQNLSPRPRFAQIIPGVLDKYYASQEAG